MSITIDFDALRIETEPAPKLNGGETRIHAVITVDDFREILTAIDRETGGAGDIWDWCIENGYLVENKT